MKNKSLCAIVFLFLLLLGTTAWAATYYVDKNHPSASDTNPGTEALPWKTIGKAAGVANAGDTVYVKAGVYNERPYFTKVGSENNKIVIGNYVNDSVPGLCHQDERPRDTDLSGREMTMIQLYCRGGSRTALIHGEIK